MTRQCKKCNEVKDINSFPDTVTLSKSYECKECRSIYLKTYYRRNKERIMDNMRLRRKRAAKKK